MNDLIDANSIVAQIVDGTTGYLITFSPIFALIGGLLLAFVVLYILIGIFFPSRGYGSPFDDDERL